MTRVVKQCFQSSKLKLIASTVLSAILILITGCGGSADTASDLDPLSSNSEKNISDLKPTPTGRIPSASARPTTQPVNAPAANPVNLPDSGSKAISPDLVTVDGSNITNDLFHEGPIPGSQEILRSISIDTSNLTPLWKSNPLYKDYWTDGIYAYRLITHLGNNDLYPVRSRFYEGFENAQIIQGLFGVYEDWSSMTLLSPATPDIASYVKLRQMIFDYQSDFQDNRIDISRDIVHSGSNALRFWAVNSTSSLPVIKTTIDNEMLALRKNTLVSLTGWFYIASGTPTGLMDLECEFLNLSPGVRLLLSDDLEPRVEMKWGNKATYRSLPGVNAKLPRNKWFKLGLYLALTDNTNGIIQLRADNVLLIDARGPTLSDASAMYNRLQMGITANTKTVSGTVVYVDDVNLNSSQSQ